MIDDVVSQQLMGLFERHANHRLAKYFNLPYEVGVAKERCERYGLTYGEPFHRVLDMGGGLGFFVRAAMLQGHAAYLLDLPDSLISESAHIMDVPYIPWIIRDDQRISLPVHSDGTFDLITMHRVNVSQDGAMWGEKNMLRFVSSIVFPLLKPGGVFSLDPNSEFEWVLNRSMWEPWLSEAGAVFQLSDKPPSREYEPSIGSPGRAITIRKGP